VGFEKTVQRALHNSLALALPLLLAGCGGGGSGGSDDQAPDPVVVDIAIAYVERPLPLPDPANGLRDDVLNPAAFNPGARLLLRDRASPGAQARDISAGVFTADALYDVKDLEVSPDGSNILFAMRAPEIENADDDDQPRWNIWEYNKDSGALRRIISSDISAEAGDDIAPHYLADGRIVFSSTRQRQTRAILLDEGKPQYSGLDEDRNRPAFVLHVMDADGGNIRQISFNQSHDLDPTVLASGEIVFSRWDNSANNNAVSLYRVKPDGRDLSLLYGFHSQDTGTDGSAVNFVQARELANDRMLVLLRPGRSLAMGGDIVSIDAAIFIDNDQTVATTTLSGGPAQQSLAFQPVTTDASPSPHGYFNSAFPLYDGTDRLLVSWSQCRLQDTDSGTLLPCTAANLEIDNVQDAPPLYGIWIYNLADGTQKPVVSGREGIMFTDVVAMEPRSAPAYIADGVGGVDLDADLVDANLGIVHIRSVYDLDGVDSSLAGIKVLADPLQSSADQRPARFIRIVKAVAQPDDDLVDIRGTAFGRSSAQLMREIIGYARVEPDGSAQFKLPANIPFAISILDAQGKRISGRHNNWLQVMPGEQRQCSGCHTNDSRMPHGRAEAEAPSINTGAVSTGIPFANTEPALFADDGETMAQTLARIKGTSALNVNLEYVDEWTNPALRPKDLPFTLSYADLATPAPATAACQANWQGQCRIVINYAEHIQPLWDRDRRVLDTDEVTVLQDHSCISCHSTRDAADTVRIPDAQLELGNLPSGQQAEHLVSYRELLFTDVEQELVDGALLDKLVQATDGAGNLLFETDDMGNLVLDADGNPLPIMVTIPVPPVMSVNGAQASARFFAPFANGGSHFNYLQPAELRLISEWLDIGAQYYNNPFAVPQN
jgi:hypothetical protein